MIDVDDAKPVRKRCSCGRTFTAHEWSLLDLLGTMTDDVDVIELRNCPSCGSTLAEAVLGSRE
jgi:ribosomal protein S27AE